MVPPAAVGVAVKVTVVPSHTGKGVVLIKTAGEGIGVTVIVKGVDVAGVEGAQVAFDVIAQVITSLFAGIYE